MKDIVHIFERKYCICGCKNLLFQSRSNHIDFLVSEKGRKYSRVVSQGKHVKSFFLLRDQIFAKLIDYINKVLQSLQCFSTFSFDGKAVFTVVTAVKRLYGFCYLTWKCIWLCFTSSLQRNYTRVTTRAAFSRVVLPLRKCIFFILLLF